MSKPSSKYCELAHEFSVLLAERQISSAEKLISDSLHVDLAFELSEMLDYSSGVINHVEVMEELTSWPEQKKNDLSWVYVALCGDDFSEAVSVVISDINSKLVITEIEWGRP